MFTISSSVRWTAWFLTPVLCVAVCCGTSKGQSSPPQVNTTTLDSYDGTHPRVLLDSSTIGTIKANISNPPAGSRWGSIWSSFTTNVDQQVTTYPTAYNASDIEQITERATAYGINAFAFAYLMTKTAQPSADTQWFEAEDAVLVPPMARAANALADGGMVIGTPAGGSVNTNTTTPSAIYDVSTLKTGYYHVWARVYASSSSANAFWFGMDANAPVSISTNTFGSWVWVNCGSSSLTPGTHQMNVTYEKPGLLIDSYAVTADSSLVPAGLGTEQHWLRAADFTLTNNTTYAVNTSDSLATGDACLSAPATVASRTSAPAAGSAGDAQQTFSLNGGTYDVWVRYKGPKTTANAFYLALDNGAYGAVTLPTGSSAVDWIWQKALGGVGLTAGSHVLNVSNDKTGCAVDRFFVAATGTASPVDPNKYLVSARNWALASINYPTWGQKQYANNDIAAASQLAALGLYYDWCYGDLGLADRQQVSSLIATRGALFYQGYTGDTSNGVPVAWWRTDYLQNLFWNYLSQFTIAGLAIHGDAGMPDTLPWLQAALGGLNNTMNDFGPDGADHEGPSYWGSILFLLQYLDLSKKELGVDFTSVPWFSETGNWRLYFNTATNYFNVSGPHINFADSVTYEWDGPDYSLRKLASLYNQPTLQWLAGKLDDTTNNDFNLNPTNPGFQWLNLLWYNSSIAETSPQAADLSPFMHFPDLDFTVSRSDWSGNEAIVAFQCGPFQGHYVQAQDHPFANWGSGHEHPAANNFCFYFNGEWQIMNAGYTDKFSRFENTLLVNGAGQLGEGGFTFNGTAAQGEDAGGVPNPAIDTSLSFSTAPMDYLVGEASGAYPSGSGLTKFERHLLYLKPDVLVVVDDVALSAAEPLELHFFPWQRSTPPVVSGSGNSYFVTGGSSKLSLNVLSAPAQTATTYATATITDNGASSTRSLFKLATGSSTPLAAMSTAVSLASSTLTGTPRTVTFLADADGTAWKFKVNGETMVLDRNATANAPDEQARLVTCVEAESVTPSSPMQVYTDEPDASGGAYIAAAPGSVTNQPDTLPAPNAQYILQAPAAGTYTLWVRIKAADGNSHSFWYALNPAGTGAYTSLCDTQTFGSWQWVKLTTVSFAADTSTNVLGIKFRQAGCKIDQFILTDDNSYTPTGKY